MLKKCLVDKVGVVFLFGYTAAMNLALLMSLLNLHHYILVAGCHFKRNLPQYHKNKH